MQRYSLRSKRFKPHIGLPSSEVLKWKDKLLECLILKKQQGLHLVKLEGYRKQTPLLKGVHKISHAASPSRKAVI